MVLKAIVSHKYDNKIMFEYKSVTYCFLNKYDTCVSHFYLFVVNASDNHVLHVSHVTNIQMTNTVFLCAQFRCNQSKTGGVTFIFKHNFVFFYIFPSTFVTKAFVDAL